MRRPGSMFVFAISIVLLASGLFAQQIATTAVPNLIRYSGTLKDTQGTPLAPDTTVGATFAIYKQQDGGAAIWQETQNVRTDANGQYSVVLGSTTATGLPSDLFSQQEERWLGVQVEGEAEQPRVLLVSVPYAFKAHEAETLGGKSVSDFVLANGASSSTTAVNGSTASSSASANQPGAGTKTGAASAGPTNFSGSTSDQIVKVTQTGTGFGVNAAASSNAVLGTATAASGTAYGVQGLASGTGGSGVLGNATSSSGSTFGVKGATSSNSGTGVRGEATASSGNTVGISGYVASATGTAAIFSNAGGGRILSGASNGAEQFAVDGNGNVNTVAGSFQIGGTNVLSISHNSLFIGAQAGSHTTGPGNTFCGYQAGASNTSGSGNTFTGLAAGFSNTVGNNNVFYGYEAGHSNSTGCCNNFVGQEAGFANTTGASNAYLGDKAGVANTTGSYGAFVGHKAGLSNTTGSLNTFIGPYAGELNTIGANNIFLGANAGIRNANGSSDLYIGSAGGNVEESNTIRIGSQGAGAGQQNTAYIAGIRDSTVTGGKVVFVESDGKLGTTGGSGLVTSFNGRGGAVAPAANDYTFELIGGTLGNLQLAGTYTRALTFTNTTNSYSGHAMNIDTSYQISGANVLGVGAASLFVGVGAGSVNTGANNTFAGYQAGFANTTGSSNAFFGDKAGAANVAGASNSFFGHKAGASNSTGQKNTFSGTFAGTATTTGSYDTFYGQNAGLNNTTGSSDVYIANVGPGAGTESNTIRIGTQGTNVGQQNAAYIAGIFGATSASGIPVLINSDGLLGTLTSSLRFKEQVRDMGESTNALMKLRPVTFLYKPEYDKGERTLQYGLIAEEVAKVYPELVAYDKDGNPYTVRYQYLASMLLNEVQKQYRRAQDEASVIQQQQQEIESLKAQLQMQSASVQERLSRLERLVETQVETVAQK
jgi:hypothetical protein